MNYKNLNYEIETMGKVWVVVAMVCLPMNYKNLNYEIETRRKAIGNRPLTTYEL